MRNKRKAVALLLAVAVVVAAFSGCSTEKPAETAVSQTEEEQQTAPEQEVQEAEEETPEAEAEEETPEAEIVEEPPETEVEEEIPAEESKGEIVLGDERFEEYLPLLEGKRVAIFTNQTGIVGGKTDGEHILDALIARDVEVTAVFSPEHGFRGDHDAGAGVENSVDEKTGVPILSLYGNSRSGSLSEQDLERFDILVVDIQDVGLRFYTYYLTMMGLMDSCAEGGKAVIVLDRPNPNGCYVDGPILREEYRSGVGRIPIPVVHGMTLGELAQMIVGEDWLQNGENELDLTVIACSNYSHSDLFELIVPPSPNLRDMQAIYLYPSLCLFENTAVSVGRGTEVPFEIYGSPYLEGADGYSYTFVPQSIPGAQNPPFLGETCFGVDLREKPQEEIRNEQIHLEYLIDAYEAVQETSPEVSFFGKPDDSGRYWIDKLAGTDTVRIMIEDGNSADEIRESWKEEVEAFREQRREYLLYPEN